MIKKSMHSPSVDAACLTVASLGLSVTLTTKENDAELRALIERYEQLLCDWESLSHRALKALSRRAPNPTESRDAVRRS